MACCLLTAQFAYISTIAGVSGIAPACAPAKNAAAICIGRSCELRHELIHPVGRERLCGPHPKTIIALPARRTILGINYGWACLLRWQQLQYECNFDIGHCGSGP
ncbi:uncharacterized protein TrAtP1_008497 [Trichoderma atroviride]|uniref:Secreted protein n=1 Tax=Hypocrea atroviridis (strain ATCC 20476 / IMI 206040) TaxID=452589 RepID=G9NZY5_HYPAI|nr:uncharacterized protein TRIATDRAFT_300373 [Trichoderma atroviride IMI 206040]EHK44032.1 hypothetical protein TRIATDRAFT_300373 [Trichoderma atroviride IMI 206040]UKZ67336.1 hypothetical protein TrAtP1_008497 [Trichoderma atroviride]